MSLAKRLLYAFCALALEAAAWAGALSDDGQGAFALLAYLLAHAGASACFACLAVSAVPAALTQARRPLMLLMFGTALAIPLLGFLGVGAGVLVLRLLPPAGHTRVFRAVRLPQFDPHLRPGSGFRQAGMRSFLANALAPAATRLRALVALQNVSGRLASPLLRDVLGDPSEDIRLLAYGMLERKEKQLSRAIHDESMRFDAAAGSAERGDAAKRLADLYWELVYQRLAQGDLRQHALQRSLHYMRIALAQSPDDAALHLRRGRLLQSLAQPHLAQSAYDRALALGLPKTRIVPYLAEVAYDVGDYASVRTLMNELGDWQSLPRLRPVIDYWRHP